MNNKIKTLVLGGGGFIGTHLVKELLSTGKSVRVLERPNTMKVLQHENLEWIEGDFGNKQDIIRSLQNVDVVFHLVSTTQPQTSNLNTLFDVKSNLLNTLVFLEEIKNMPEVKIIFLSSGGTVYGRPIQIPIPETHPTYPQCSYGIVKLAIEKYLSLYHQMYGLNYRVLRLSNPYGPGQANPVQGVIGAFLMRISKGLELEVWGDGKIVRDYIYIGDAIDALLLTADYSGEFRVFNIGSGKGKSIQDIILAVESTIGKKAVVNYTEKREFDVPVSILDIQLAQNELKWKPKTSLNEGLLATKKWMNFF